MKFSVKHLAAAAAFIANSAVVAAPAYDWTMATGEASLVLPYQAYSTLLGLGTVIRTPAIIPSFIGLNHSGDINPALFNKSTGQIRLNISEVTSANDSLTLLQSDRAFVDFRRTELNEEGDFSHYSVFMTDWDVDLTTSTIYANLYSRLVPSSSVTNLGRTAVFTATIGGAGGHVEPTSVTASGTAWAYASGHFQGELHMRTETVNLLMTNLHMDADFYAADIAHMLRTMDWGTVSFYANLTGTPAVPEPSDFILISAGLLALGVKKRFDQRA